jgi:hypothetical protein
MTRKDDADRKARSDAKLLATAERSRRRHERVQQRRETHTRERPVMDRGEYASKGAFSPANELPVPRLRPSRRRKGVKKRRDELLDEQRKADQRKPSGLLFAADVHHDTGNDDWTSENTLDVLGLKYESGQRTSRGAIHTSDTHKPLKKPEPAPDKRRTTLTLPAPPKERVVGPCERLDEDHYYRPKPAGQGKHGHKRGRPKKQKREQRVNEDFGYTPEPYDLDSIRLGGAIPDHGARPSYLGSQERHLHARAEENDPGPPTERERQKRTLAWMLGRIAREHAPGKSWWDDDAIARWFADVALPDARALVAMDGLSPAKGARTLERFEQQFWRLIDYHRCRRKNEKMTNI